MMEQYRRIKRENREAILFFRMGDFYEMFYDDARIAARVLGIALTARRKGPNAVPMAGVPHHSVQGYVRKMIKAGYRVAICDQLQDSAEAQGVVERGVTRIITPGTIIEEDLLEEKSSNYLAAICPGKDVAGLAWVEASTGEFVAEDVPLEELADELARISPAECILPESAAGADNPRINALAREHGGSVSPHREWVFDRQTAYRILLKHFKTASLEGFGCEDIDGGISAAGALIDYLNETQRTSLAHISSLKPHVRGKYCVLDRTTRRCLELVRSQREASREGTLLWIMDRTMTPMGGRLLASCLTLPLRDVKDIERRQDGVEFFLKDATRRKKLRKLLHEITDMERLAAKIGSRRCNARDLLGLGRALALLPDVRKNLEDTDVPIVAEVRDNIADSGRVAGIINSAIAPDAPHTLQDGGLIREGHNGELDELRTIQRSGREWIASFQAAEIKRTGIPSLKVGFNQVFGYYIEVTRTHDEKVPPDYIRKQTLKNAERYITPELKEYETRVLNAEERAKQLEYELFVDVRDRVAEHVEQILRSAAAVANIDMLLALGQLASENNYVRPRVVDDLLIDIREGRHPVLEKTLTEESFVPNDLLMDGDEKMIAVITGPNMAGKSTYIRQSALLVLMAQVGSFVPAKRATIGVADRIFTRVGAADDIARGQSTFMVEMSESANILNNATRKSLIVLDEVGRGTSTFDGVSIAWAVTEYIHNNLKARTLFATHYHELTELALILPGVKNYNIAVKEWKDEVIFLRKVVEGGTDKSYGIHVARLAGIPSSIIERAKVILTNLEAETLDIDGKPRFAMPRTPRPGEMQLSLFSPRPHPVVEKLKEIDIHNLTPVEALNLLNLLRGEVVKEDEER